MLQIPIPTSELINNIKNSIIDNGEVPFGLVISLKELKELCDQLEPRYTDKNGESKRVPAFMITRILGLDVLISSKFGWMVTTKEQHQFHLNNRFKFN